MIETEIKFKPLDYVYFTKKSDKAALRKLNSIDQLDGTILFEKGGLFIVIDIEMGDEPIYTIVPPFIFDTYGRKCQNVRGEYKLRVYETDLELASKQALIRERDENFKNIAIEAQKTKDDFGATIFNK